MIHVDETDPVGEIEPPFPYRDVTLKRNTDVNDFYEMLSEIGRGKFGTVYLCREKSTGLELAAKVVSVSRRDERRNVEREVDVMRRLRHPRLIQLYDAYDWGKYMCVVLELITGGELFERVIDEDFVLTERACTVFMRQICEGIDFVHRQNILHLDMKPENILCLTKAGNRIKIIDFGLARLFDPEKKLQVLFGTPEFVAPEVVNFDQIGYSTDMWSVGVICYVLLSGLSPFMGETDIETMANVTIAKYDFDDEAFNEISEDAKDFIRRLLVKDKECRPSASECLRHAWLARRPAPKPQKPQPPPKQELDVTKDNLRFFVERWSEHPNSPYVFDNQSHEITSLANGNCEKSSIGGCSPSPRSSLSSSPDGVFDEDDLEPPPLREHSFSAPRYKPVERRASDSSCFLHKKHDVFVRKNLAEEIKKLSDHLFMLSTMNTDLANNNNNSKELDKNVTETKTVQKEETKLANGFRKETQTSVTKTFTNGDASNKEKKLFTSKSSHRVTSSFLFEREPERPMTSQMPWAKSTRSKRVTSLNRDVPDQPTERRNSFFEEFDKRREKIDKLVNPPENGRQFPYRRGEDNAHRTKDLLLHLLEKWGETDGVEAERTAGGTSNSARHQSISLEYSPSNQLAQNSMSSVHAFYQRQTSNDKAQRKNITIENPK